MLFFWMSILLPMQEFQELEHGYLLGLPYKLQSVLEYNKHELEVREICQDGQQRNASSTPQVCLETPFKRRLSGVFTSFTQHLPTLHTASVEDRAGFDNAGRKETLNLPQ
jgi:hypothetical protein